MSTAMIGRLTEREADTLFSVLKDRYQRRILRCLRRSPEMTVKELAQELARDADRSTSTERMLASLHHVHLPKLASMDVIRYEPEGGTVATTANAEKLLEYVDSIGARFEGE